MPRLIAFKCSRVTVAETELSLGVSRDPPCPQSSTYRPVPSVTGLGDWLQSKWVKKRYMNQGEWIRTFKPDPRTSQIRNRTSPPPPHPPHDVGRKETVNLKRTLDTQSINLLSRWEAQSWLTDSKKMLRLHENTYPYWANAWNCFSPLPWSFSPLQQYPLFLL